MCVQIRFDHVSKRYRLYQQRPFLARQVLRALLQRPASVREHWALTDVSFEVSRGDAVGVIGVNGSGKSTLLSLIARTSYPTSGNVAVEGSVGPLLELGAGFHIDLTGRENVHLNAALLGLSRQEVDERFEQIVAYADIGRFIDAPLSTYSTGMRARLGFAVIAHVDPDIVLLDEVLAVGDGQFAEKCNRTIRGFKEAEKTLVFVSHSLAQVEMLCERVLWVHGGRLHADGPANEVIASYVRFLESSGTDPASSRAALSP